MSLEIFCLKFESDRLLMELCLDEDREAMLKLHSDNLSNDYLKPAFGLPPESVTKALCDRFINNKISTNEYYTETDFENLTCLFFKIVRKDTKELIGALEIYEKFDFAFEIGIFIESNSKNLGFATECLQSFVKFAKQHSNIKTLYFCCHFDNLASGKVAEKCNFEQTRLFVENGINAKELKLDLC